MRRNINNLGVGLGWASEASGSFFSRAGGLINKDVGGV